MIPKQLIDKCTPEEREAVLAVAHYMAFADGRFWREKPLLVEWYCRASVLLH